MKVKAILKTVAVFAAMAALVASCSSDKKTSAGGSSGGSASSSSSADFVALGGWKDPACSTSQPKVSVGISEPLEVAGTSLRDYVDGTQAAVDAFNAEGHRLPWLENRQVVISLTPTARSRGDP